MSVVFCDEAGNSGENLLDEDQPIFVLASNDFDADEGSALLQHLKSPQIAEPKFSTLRKTPNGINRILALLADPLLSKDRVAVNAYHKRFMIVTKIVDLIFETLMHNAGEDLYVDGRNIAMSNMLFACLPALCGEVETDNYLQTFVTLMREKTPDAAAAYYAAGRTLAANCEDGDFRAFLKPAIEPRLFRRWFDGIGKMSLDPAIPALFDHIVIWGKRKADRFKIIHDRSKPILATRDLFHALMADAEEELSTIGYDRRQFEFPLKATSLEDGDSKLLPQLQVADVCAGCINYFMKCQVSGLSDRLSEGIHALGCLDWSINALLPGSEVTPDELGVRPSQGTNPIDPMVEKVARSNLPNSE